MEGIYQQRFFLQQLQYEKRRKIVIAICYNEYSILLTKKQGLDPENRQYIDKSQNDCYPYPSSREDPPRSGGGMRGESLFGAGVG